MGNTSCHTQIHNLLRWLIVVGEKNHTIQGLSVLKVSDVMLNQPQLTVLLILLLLSWLSLPSINEEEQC
jgi:hypothetical protein